MAVALDALRESIERQNDTFEALLNLIPARFYISKEPDETEVSVPHISRRLKTTLIGYRNPQLSSKYMKNKRKRDAPKQAVKEASKKARRDKVRTMTTLA